MNAVRVQWLKEALGRLAAPAEEQVRYLSGLFGRPVAGGFNTDELALELDDALLGLHSWLGADAQAQLGKALEELLAELDALSGESNAGFWTAGALFEDARWERVRALAARCLAASDFEP